MIQDLIPKEFKDYLVDDEVTLVDVREQWEFDICQIKGAILIPMNEISNMCGCVHLLIDCVTVIVSSDVIIVVLKVCDDGVVEGPIRPSREWISLLECSC